MRSPDLRKRQSPPRLPARDKTKIGGGISVGIPVAIIFHFFVAVGLHACGNVGFPDIGLPLSYLL
jgi:hypothetical protein